MSRVMGAVFPCREALRDEFPCQQVLSHGPSLERGKVFEGEGKVQRDAPGADPVLMYFRALDTSRYYHKHA